MGQFDEIYEGISAAVLRDRITKIMVEDTDQIFLAHCGIEGISEFIFDKKRVDIDGAYRKVAKECEADLEDWPFFYLVRDFLVKSLQGSATRDEIINAISTAQRLEEEEKWASGKGRTKEISEQTKWARMQKFDRDYNEIKALMDQGAADSIFDYYLKYYNEFSAKPTSFHQVFKPFVRTEIFPFYNYIVDDQQDCLSEIVDFVNSDHYPLLQNFLQKDNPQDKNRLKLFSDLLAYKGQPLSRIALTNLIYLQRVDSLKKDVFASFQSAVDAAEHRTVPCFIKEIYKNHTYINEPLPRFLLLKFLKNNGIQPAESEVDNAIKVEQLMEFENELTNCPPRKQCDLDSLDGYQFEHLLAEVFQRAGFKVNHTPLSNDKGADLIIQKGRDSTAIQLKHSKKVGTSAVQEVVASMKFYDANGCMVITSGSFSRAARELAEKNDVTLWEKDELIKFIEKTM